MINKVILTGRLTQAPELRYTTSNVPMVQASLAVNRSFKNADNQQEVDFINIVLWRQRAETLAKYCQKGSLIGVEGSLQTRTYEDNNGNRRTAYDVVVDNFTFLESRRDSNSYQQPQPTYNQQQPAYNQPQQPTYNQQQAPQPNQYEQPKPDFAQPNQSNWADQGGDISTGNPTVDFGDINEDDLPF